MRLRNFLVWLVLLLPVAQAAAEGYGWSEWMRASELAARLQEMDEDRLFPAIVEGRLEGTAIRYRAQFVPYVPNLVYFESRWGMSDAWYKTHTEQFTEAGFVEYSHTWFTDLSGAVVHQTTWVLIGD